MLWTLVQLLLDLLEEIILISFLWLATMNVLATTLQLLPNFDETTGFLDYSLVFGAEKAFTAIYI